MLDGAYVAAAVRCAPPANKPTPDERERCVPYLERELALLPDVCVIVVLGHFAHDVICKMLGVRPRPKFGHGVETDAGGGRTLLGSYHPSQQNTFTGTLTESMFDAVFTRARQITG
jgi:uracil-DNA glycosylase family 4